jgi:LysR family hydrogen peroxide-inducible transcriptional activator
MNLNQLRFVSALASSGSFTAAASACAVTQPTLSNAIAQLETNLGQRLFVRTTRKVSLTAFGAHVLPDIERVLGAQQALIQCAQEFLNPQKRLIRIGTSPLLNARFVNLLIEPFHTKSPDIDLVFREMNMADLSRMLEAEQLDFVFGVVGPRKDQRESAFLYREPLRYVPKGEGHMVSRRGDAASFDEIAGETFVMVPDACGLTRTIRGLFRSHRRTLHEYSGEAMSYQVIEQWAALGIGAAILPESKLSTDGHGALRIRDKTGEDVLLSFEAVWNRSSIKLRHLAGFATYLREIVPTVAGGLAVPAALRNGTR